MASIVGKRRGRRTYYYLVESARVDGEPRIISQQYLGTAEEVLARLSGVATGAPVRTQHKRFGDLAAVWSVLERYDQIGSYRSSTWALLRRCWRGCRAWRRVRRSGPSTSGSGIWPRCGRCWSDMIRSDHIAAVPGHC